MRKFGLLLLLILGLACCGLFSDNAGAEQGTDSQCTTRTATGGIFPVSTPTNPDDEHFFPYGFICGGSKAYPHAAHISVSGASGGHIDNNSSITVEGWFDQTGTPKYSGGSNREVLVWMEIDGDDQLMNDTNALIHNINGGSPVKTDCPGTGSVGKVYNWRDRSAGVSGPDQSPVAWDGGSFGIEDCGTSGRMVYWKNASGGTHYKFDVDFKNGKQGQYCLRLNVSVRFGGEKYFPSNTDNPVDYNSVASHLAKQSVIRCFIVDPPPTPSISVTSNCNTISGKVTNAAKYKLFFDGDASFHPQTNTGSSNYNYSYSPAGLAGKWGNGSTTHTVLARAYNSAGTIIASATYSVKKNCASPGGIRCHQNPSYPGNGSLTVNFNTGAYNTYVITWLDGSGPPINGVPEGKGITNNNNRVGNNVQVGGAYGAPNATYDAAYYQSASAPSWPALTPRISIKQIMGEGTSSQTFRIWLYNTHYDSAGNIVYDPGLHVIDITDQKDCINNDPYTDFSYTCNSITFFNLRDPDQYHQDVHYAGSVMYRNAAGGSTGIKAAEFDAWGRGNITLTFDIVNSPTSIPAGGQYGLVFSFGAVNEMNAGADPGDPPGEIFNYVTEHAIGPCLSATCTLKVIGNSGLPANSVFEGEPYTIEATITNVSPSDRLDRLPWALGGPQIDHLGITFLGDADNNFLNLAGKQVPLFQDVPRTETRGPITITSSGVTVGSNPGVYTLDAYPDYIGRFGLSNDSHSNIPPPISPDPYHCQAQIRVYGHFHLDAQTTMTANPTEENPTSFTYSANVTNSNTKAAVRAPTETTLYKKRYAGATTQLTAPQLRDGPWNPGSTGILSGTYNVPPGSFNAGDDYCVRTEFKPFGPYGGGFNDGYVGPGGPTDVYFKKPPYPPARSIYNANANDLVHPKQIYDEPGKWGDKACRTIHNKPYVKVYGSGISAGGSYTCGTGGIIGAWNNNLVPSTNRGAGSQLNALATLAITGLGSARGYSPARPPTVLSFANQSPFNGASDRESPAMHGNFGGCTPLTKASPKAGHPVLPSGTTIGTKMLGAGARETIYVDGHVFINGNITYSGSWTKDTVPSFVLIAKGNIYIAPGVQQLDGWYTSQSPNGKIYTCASGVGAPAIDFNNCKEQLKVHGSFVADRINLLRTFGSLRNSTPGEMPAGFAPGSPMTPCEYYTATQPNQVCAAEVFNFSPELYLGKPDIERENGGAIQYDAITNLPPVL